MDEQSHVHVAVHNRILDEVEGSEYGNEVGLIHLEGEVRAGERARNRDALSLYIRADGWLTRHQARSIPVAHGGAMRQQRIPVADVRICMNGNRRDLQLPPQGALVQRFDILKLMHVRQALGIDLSRGECVEHERII